MSQISVNVLLYGHYPHLASRVLSRLLGAPGSIVQDLRIGLNDVCEETREYVWKFCGSLFTQAPCHVYEPPTNVGKYPLMRRMFYDEKRPLAPLTMWFDDDSYLSINSGPRFWESVIEALPVTDNPLKPVMLGYPHYIKARGQQLAGIIEQPWYGKMPFGNPHMYYFATGGWWTARTAFITQWDYPFADLHHSGGDSILGELLRQQQRRINGFHNAVCHCPSDGCVERALRCGNIPNQVHINHADRRGVGVHRSSEVYVFEHWISGSSGYDYSHHSFPCDVHSFG